ncbi:hypothetical protein HanRHA438_Chr06g0267941 [Helianthus annuus]|nr:hypothetical protein HanIR_Chr06g0278521 [Helianthus annuus]KAJ0911867.1 hypothetical protein HanRHA438_Chr06g0267941 [Helianthus annuus]
MNRKNRSNATSTVTATTVITAASTTSLPLLPVNRTVEYDMEKGEIVEEDGGDVWQQQQYDGLRTPPPSLLLPATCISHFR